MTDGPQTQEEFVEHYRRLCGHIARNFVQRRKRRLENASGKDEAQSAQLPNYLTKRGDFEAQDLASAALVRLLRCPQDKWNQPYYVKRIIVNAIIDEAKRQEHIFGHEFCPFLPAATPEESGADYFDTLPGRDGLAQSTQLKYDAQRITNALAVLSHGERLVITLYFGLDGVRARRERAIAASLGRTEFWVERRLAAGLNRLRKEIGVTPLSCFALPPSLWEKPANQKKLKSLPSYPGQTIAP